MRACVGRVYRQLARYVYLKLLPLTCWDIYELEHVLFSTRAVYYTAQDPCLASLEVLVV